MAAEFWSSDDDENAAKPSKRKAVKSKRVPSTTPTSQCAADGDGSEPPKKPSSSRLKAARTCDSRGDVLKSKPETPEKSDKISNACVAAARRTVFDGSELLDLFSNEATVLSVRRDKVKKLLDRVAGRLESVGDPDLVKDLEKLKTSLAVLVPGARIHSKVESPQAYCLSFCCVSPNRRSTSFP